MTRLPREPSVSTREKFPLETRVAGDITLCGNSMPSSDSGYVAGRSAGYQKQGFYNEVRRSGRGNARVDIMKTGVSLTFI